jgi:membrane protein
LTTEPDDRQHGAGHSNTPEGAQPIGKNEASEVIPKIETDARALEMGVVEDIGVAEKKVETSKTGQRLETIEKEAQAHKTIQLAEKEAKTFANFLLKWNHDWSLSLSGALAYSLLTALFPMAVVLLSLFGVFAGTRAFLITHLITALPVSTDTANSLRVTILQRLPKTSGIVWVLVILVAIFTGSRLFTLMDKCFNIIYQVDARPYVRQTGMSMGMFLLFILFIPIMVFASSVPALLISLLPHGNLPHGGLLLSGASIFGSLIVSILLFSAIYVIVPNQHISIRTSWRGTVVATLLLQIYLLLFPLYVTHFFTGYDEQIGAVIILLAFFYYFAVILLLGAQVNAFYAEGKRAAPSDLATLVHRTTSGAAHPHAVSQPPTRGAMPPL